MSVFSVLGSLTAKCGSKSMRSVSLKPEIFSALGRWSTTACSGTPLPRPLEPLPRALTAPRPRGWTPRPRPGDSSPRLAAWKKTIRAHQNTAGVEIMFHHLKFQEQVCPQVATVQAAFLYMVSSLPSFFFFLIQYLNLQLGIFDLQQGCVLSSLSLLIQIQLCIQQFFLCLWVKADLIKINAGHQLEF